MRNVFAGRVGPRSVPSLLCPGTQLWQEPHGCPRFSLPTCTLALSEPCLWKHRDAYTHELHPTGNRGRGGDFNEARVVLSPPPPASTYVLRPLRGQAAAPLVSDRTAAECCSQPLCLSLAAPVQRGKSQPINHPGPGQALSISCLLLPPRYTPIHHTEVCRPGAQRS